MKGAVKIQYEVSNCMKCPKHDGATSDKGPWVYHVCREENRLLPTPKMEKGGHGSFVRYMERTIDIPIWCPYNRVEE